MEWNNEARSEYKTRDFITDPKLEAMRGITWLRIRSRGWHRTYFHRQELHQLGYTFDGKTKEWKMIAADGDIEKAQAYCKSRSFHLFIDLPQYRRNSIYRKTFFDSHPGLFGRDFYFCSYCGKLLKKDKVTVDHVFAVKAVQQSRFLKWLLKTLGMGTVNDRKNLVPACSRCNERKGAKGGLWILRGFIGRHPVFWFAYWTIVFAVLIALIVYCIPLLESNFKFFRLLI